MSRQRLTKEAATDDVYTMNGARPAEEQRGGNGSGDKFFKEYDNENGTAYGETPITTEETKKLHEEDMKRDDMNIGEMREAMSKAIKNAKDLDDRASRCIIASERMLPGASGEVIEANALDLMLLPDPSINAILERQASLAASVVAAAEEEEEEEVKEAGEEAGEEAEEEAKEAGEEAGEDAGEEVPAEEKTAEEDKFAAIEKMVNDKFEKLAEMIMAGKGEEAPVEDEELPAEDEETPVEDEELPAEEKEASSKVASSNDGLDSIFEASQVKTSVSAGMVRKASEKSSNVLEGLWGTTPDVSSVFGQ